MDSATANRTNLPVPEIQGSLAFPIVMIRSLNIMQAQRKYDDFPKLCRRDFTSSRLC